MLHILVFSLGLAHAGIFEWCAKFLVMDDPFQFEELEENYVQREVDRLTSREKWGVITVHELSVLKTMRAELAKRARIQAILNDNNPL